nr:MAG TPA: hypothetical protein [Caudoviricetes sp.]
MPLRPFCRGACIFAHIAARCVQYNLSCIWL